MSSRSIGVTNVSFRRRMMSWVIRSPSCSHMRMSRVSSSRRSGNERSSWSSRSAARTMFPPASSKRSKYRRSRETSNCERRATGGPPSAFLALSPQTQGGRGPRGGAVNSAPRLPRVAEQLVVALRGTREEAANVRHGRAVAVAGGAVDERLGERGELAHELGPELVAAGPDRGAHDAVLGRVVRLRRPALSVSADPGGVELAQALDGLSGPRAE